MKRVHGKVSQFPILVRETSKIQARLHGLSGREEEEWQKDGREVMEVAALVAAQESATEETEDDVEGLMGRWPS